MINKEKFKYGHTFELKIIASLITDSLFLKKMFGQLKKDYFDSEANGWLLTVINNHFQEYRQIPSLDVFKVEIEKINDDVLRQTVVSNLREITVKYSNVPDLDYIKDETIKFCISKNLSDVILDSPDYIEAGKFEEFKMNVDNAIKLNFDDDLGHNYLTDFDLRYDEQPRNTLETPWPIINEITDGGLGGGEFGVFVANPGVGKCVGPNTEIEIEYDQIGIESNGKMIWYNPWDSVESSGQFKKLIRKKIKIKTLFDSIGIANSESIQYLPNFDIKVNTPYGYKKIKNFFRTEKLNPVTLYFGNNRTLTTSTKHLLKVNGDWKYVKDIKLNNDVIDTESGITHLKKITKKKENILYDIEVEDVNCYYSNGILSHNSWALVNIAAHAMSQNKKVIYYTLELKDRYVSRRFDSFYSKIAPHNLQYYREEIKGKLPISLDGTELLKTKYYPSYSTTINHLEAHVEKCIFLGFKPELIIIDYPDLLKNIVTHQREDLNLNNIYTMCRGLAGRFDVPVWAASQARRCLKLDTKIITSLGEKQIGKLSIGEKILTHKGYKKITYIYPKQKQTTYKIKLKSGKEICCSAKHEFPVSYGILKSIESGLKVGDKLLTKKI